MSVCSWMKTDTGIPTVYGSAKNNWMSDDWENETDNIVINNPNNIEIESVQIINMIGQSIYKYDVIKTNEVIEFETKNISTGSYIIKLNTEIGEISKKVLVK